MDFTSGEAKSASADVDASPGASGVFVAVTTHDESEVFEAGGADGDTPSFPNQFTS
jgi:hypothetical protein